MNLGGLYNSSSSTVGEAANRKMSVHSAGTTGRGASSHSWIAPITFEEILTFFLSKGYLF